MTSTAKLEADVDILAGLRRHASTRLACELTVSFFCSVHTLFSPPHSTTADKINADLKKIDSIKKVGEQAGTEPVEESEGLGGRAGPAAINRSQGLSVWAQERRAPHCGAKPPMA